MENNRKKEGGKRELDDKEQKFRMRVWGAALVIGLILAGRLAVCKNIEIVVKIQSLGKGILMLCSPILVCMLEAVGKCHFFKEVFWKLLKAIIPWGTVAIILFILPITAVAYITVDELKEIEKNSEDNLSPSEVTKTVEQKEDMSPKRTEKAFVWEEDIYVDDLSEYYDGEISEKDEARYIRELILEDLSHMKKGAVTDMSGFSEDYSVNTTKANYSFELYQDIKDGPYPEENIENALLVAIKYRELADESQRVSGNLRQLGMLKDTWGDWNYRRGKGGWEKDYEESLRYYILSLKHAIKEVENGLFSTEQSQIEDNWEAVIKEYGKVSGTERVLDAIRGL